MKNILEIKQLTKYYGKILGVKDLSLSLEENDYSYRFARLGEDYDDYEEKYYDSDSDKENYLEFPSVLREFEDEYIIDLMKVNDNLEK